MLWLEMARMEKSVVPVPRPTDSDPVGSLSTGRIAKSPTTDAWSSTRHLRLA